MKIVNSFFDGNVTYDPLYTKLDEVLLEPQGLLETFNGKAVSLL